MKKAIALVTAVLILAMGIRYSWLAWQGPTEPIVATWLMLAVAISISWWTYRSSGKKSILGNIANATDLVAVWMILLSAIFLGRQVRLGFNAFEIWCLMASGIILAVWRLTGRSIEANYAIQAIMTIAYFPTIAQLWSAARNTEPFGTWIVFWIAGVGALVTGILDRNKLGIVYAARALGIVSVVLALMLRLELRGP